MLIFKWKNVLALIPYSGKKLFLIQYLLPEKPNHPAS